MALFRFGICATKETDILSEFCSEMGYSVAEVEGYIKCLRSNIHSTLYFDNTGIVCQSNGILKIRKKRLHYYLQMCIMQMCIIYRICLNHFIVIDKFSDILYNFFMVILMHMLCVLHQGKLSPLWGARRQC